MNQDYTAHWHKASYNLFLNNYLPCLLAERLPMAGYEANPVDTCTCRIEVKLAEKNGSISHTYIVPQPDIEGIFVIDGQSPRVVTVTAEHAKLSSAAVKCVGDHLVDYIRDRLGEAPEELEWSESLLTNWLPLDSWINDFLISDERSQILESQNRLAQLTHLRRIHLIEPDSDFHPDQFGRVCPIEMPEGPRVFHIRHMAIGADIRDGRIIPVDDDPAMMYGLSASLIPLREYGDRNRNLMGANMMRQWHIQPDPEPALVQTGLEPDSLEFCNGRNLLTAFILWDGDTYEEGLVLSRSAADKLTAPCPAEIGDKLSNRHGVKGVIARILPDDEMPQMEDGTPVELIYSGLGPFTRMQMGLLREAVIGRIARAEGAPVVLPPLEGPDEEGLRQRLNKNAMPEDGMVQLTLQGKKLVQRSNAGWVYWGKTSHDANSKIRVISHLSQDEKRDPASAKWKFTLPHGNTVKNKKIWGTTNTPLDMVEWDFQDFTWCNGQRQSAMEYWVLRDLGAYETIIEHFYTRDDGTIYPFDVDTGRENLADRLTVGPVNQSTPPSLKFLDIQQRLAHAGIIVEMKEDALHFKFGRPTFNRLKLASEVTHPWLRSHKIGELGIQAGIPGADSVVESNTSLLNTLESKMPDALIKQATRKLQQRVDTYINNLMSRWEHIGPNSRLLFSGRAVQSPGPELCYDQIGLPNEMAWTLFGPLVAQKLGDLEGVINRTEKATRILDDLMAEKWVGVTRAPAVAPTNMLAFHSVRMPDNALHVHSFVCPLMNADHDGDMCAVFLPVTESAQMEAGEVMSIAAHIKRDPSLLRTLVVKNSMWGLARLSLTPEGRKQITQASGMALDFGLGYLTRHTLSDALIKVHTEEGSVRALDTAENLMRLGYSASKSSGASINPFFGSSIDRSRRPGSNDPAVWHQFADELIEDVMARTDFDDPDIGNVLLAVKSGAHGNIEHLRRWVGAAHAFQDADGSPILPTTSFSEGRTVDVMRADVIGSHRFFRQLQDETSSFGQQMRIEKTSRADGILARAMQYNGSPMGIIFARAAANEAIDPLLDVDSRLLIGMKPR